MFFTVMSQIGGESHGSVMMELVQDISSGKRLYGVSMSVTTISMESLSSIISLIQMSFSF